MRHLAPDTVVLHWHGDTFDLPDGAKHLASTLRCANQAFCWGRWALGLQFHPEVTALGLERWYVGHAVEIGATPGVSVSELRRDADRHAPALREPAKRLFESWLAAVT